MRGGRLRNYVVIQALTGAQAGDGQPAGGYADFVRGIPAEIVGVTGGETLRGVQVQAGITDLITIRYRSDIKPQMRVVFAGRSLNIEAAIDPEGRRRELQLHCKELT